jgi:hypothetical protein
MHDKAVYRLSRFLGRRRGELGLAGLIVLGFLFYVVLPNAR